MIKFQPVCRLQDFVITSVQRNVNVQLDELNFLPFATHSGSHADHKLNV